MHTLISRGGKAIALRIDFYMRADSLYVHFVDLLTLSIRIPILPIRTPFHPQGDLGNGRSPNHCLVSFLGPSTLIKVLPHCRV